MYIYMCVCVCVLVYVILMYCEKLSENYKYITIECRYASSFSLHNTL